MRKQEEAAGGSGAAFGGAYELAPGLAHVAAAAAPVPDALKLRAVSQSAAHGAVEGLAITREASPASREREARM
jgi:hypothetical protein